MKLARKLTLAFLVIMIAVLGANALLRVQREVETFREDVKRDHGTLARGLRPAVALVWREEGEGRALALVEETNINESEILIRWVWLSREAAVTFRPRVPLEDLGPVRSGRVIDRVVETEGGAWLYTYVPVPVPRGRHGAIEIGESLADEAEAVRGTVLRATIITAMIAALGAVATSLLGLFLVGRPVAQLVAQARRVGAGDLRARLQLRQRDEIGTLAVEMNAMCERLEAARAERERALDQLQHADRLATVGKLASGIAHELGTPLDIAGIEARRISNRRATGDAAEESARLIATQIERMTRIIQQLLEFARRRSPHKTRVDVAQLVSRSVAMLRPLAERKQLQLRVEAAPLDVVADGGHLEQVVTNVLVNGMQASPPGAVLQVRLGRVERERPEGGPRRAWARVAIEDAGPGIPPDVLPHVFEPFYTTKDAGEGTGLGLSVAYGIVEEHGGFIQVTSEPGRGARFDIHLPLDAGVEAP